MEQNVEKVGSVQQEPIKDSEDLQIKKEEVLKIDVEVSVLVDGVEATIALPPEMRLTERLVAHLDQQLSARGLELKRWTLTPEQQEELRKLSNVVVKENEEEKGD